MSLVAPDLRLNGLFIAIVWFTMAFRWAALDSGYKEILAAYFLHRLS